MKGKIYKKTYIVKIDIYIIHVIYNFLFNKIFTTQRYEKKVINERDYR
jgi:hypothetical protein